MDVITDIVRRSLLAEEVLDLDPELKRNSYEDFLSGFDSGKYVIVESNFHTPTHAS